MPTWEMDRLMVSTMLLDLPDVMFCVYVFVLWWHRCSQAWMWSYPIYFFLCWDFRLFYSIFMYIIVTKKQISLIHPWREKRYIHIYRIMTKIIFIENKCVRVLCIRVCVYVRAWVLCVCMCELACVCVCMLRVCVRACVCLYKHCIYTCCGDF